MLPVFLCYAYKESSLLFKFLNDNIAHNRLRLTHNASIYYGISLFGTKAVSFEDNSNIMIDSAIIRMLYINGLIFYLVFLAIFIIMQIYFGKKNLKYINWMIIIVLLQGTMEAFMFDISSDFVLLLIPIALINNTKSMNGEISNDAIL